MRALLALSLLLGGVVAAVADPPLPADVEKQTLEQFGAAEPACPEWSDGCAVCTRDAGRMIACSLPGIACQPAAIVCRTPAPLPDKPKT